GAQAPAFGQVEAAGQITAQALAINHIIIVPAFRADGSHRRRPLGRAVLDLAQIAAENLCIEAPVPAGSRGCPVVLQPQRNLAIALQRLPRQIVLQKSHVRATGKAAEAVLDTLLIAPLAPADQAHGVGPAERLRVDVAATQLGIGISAVAMDIAGGVLIQSRSAEQRAPLAFRYRHGVLHGGELMVISLVNAEAAGVDGGKINAEGARADLGSEGSAQPMIVIAAGFQAQAIFTI